MSLSKTYSERGYDPPVFLFLRPDEPGTEVVTHSPKLVLEALGASTWQTAQQSFGYRLRGEDTLTWNQETWIEIKRILSLLEERPYTKFFETYPVQYSTLLDIVESQRLQRSSSFLTYMHQMETWAEAYDQKASVMSLEECEALYDDAFFEAMDLEKKLP